MAFAGLAKSPKVDNHPAALKAKVDIRRRVLDVIGADKAAVFDAYAGSGQMHALIIADRRPVKKGELVGVVITEGAGLSYKANVMPLAVTALTGLRQGIVGLSRKHDDVINRATIGLARRMRCGIARRWQAERNNTGPAPRYVGLVLEGIG